MKNLKYTHSYHINSYQKRMKKNNYDINKDDVKKPRYIYIYGEHACKMAILNKRRKKIILYILERNKEKYREITKLAHECNIDVKFCKNESEIPNVKNNIKDSTKNLQGIILKCFPLENYGLEYLNNILKRQNNNKPSLVIALDSITDPNNIGAILRTCAAFSHVVDAIITSKTNSPKETEAISKVSSGGIEIIPWVTVSNIKYAITSLKKDFLYSCYGIENYGDTSLNEVNLSNKSILLFGSENKGIQKILLNYCDNMVNIPTVNNFSSLNVSNASAILIYEFCRQTNFI